MKNATAFTIEQVAPATPSQTDIQEIHQEFYNAQQPYFGKEIRGEVGTSGDKGLLENIVFTGLPPV